MKAEPEMDSTDYTGVELRSTFKIEEMEESIERKNGCGKSREEKYLLSHIKEEEEKGGDRQKVKMERKDGVRNEEGLWRQQEKERDEWRERDVTDQILQTNRGKKNEGKLEYGQQEGEELDRLVTSCLLKQPRVLICRCEVTDVSVPVLSPLHSVSSKREQGGRSPQKWHELSLVKGKRSFKGQVVTQKKRMTDKLERPLKCLPASSENGICAEASHSAPVISTRNQNTGQTVEVSYQIFACSQCPFIHMEEVKLHPHVEKAAIIFLATVGQLHQRRCAPTGHDNTNTASATPHSMTDCLHPSLPLEDWWIPQSSLNQISNQNPCFKS
ncbi:hypothetical protein AAFF_G00437240 [Aldrovandia affinis]|uniref:Uncharacterized protein n=1 Tax=Aldrovandia affinis TaxID=143900 RepID=A0AAD7S7Q9_9TELE|nr:hypothetical protein AAFF_G00437240 [Aldrovandia affinis]